MSTPVETIADALIAFILSLLRDPDAAAEFHAAPEAAMAAGRVSDACLADVKTVAPIIIVFFLAQRHFIAGISMSGLK